jgi:O-methyltransferase
MRSLIQKIRRLAWRILGLDTLGAQKYIGAHGCLWCSASFTAWNQVPGDYLEFGVFKGVSFIEAYRAVWASRESVRQHIGGQDIQRWYDNRPRFFAFDSFSGLPGGTAERHLDYAEAAYACSESQFLKNIQDGGVPQDDVTTVAGYYDKTLSAEKKAELSLSQAAIVLIDCDLYESTVPVLDFITDLVGQGTIIIFDDWYRYKGSRHQGEQRACNEWLQKNPHIRLTQYWQQGPQSVAFLVNID